MKIILLTSFLFLMAFSVPAAMAQVLSCQQVDIFDGAFFDRFNQHQSNQCVQSTSPATDLEWGRYVQLRSSALVMAQSVVAWRQRMFQTEGMADELARSSGESTEEGQEAFKQGLVGGEICVPKSAFEASKQQCPATREKNLRLLREAHEAFKIDSAFGPTASITRYTNFLAESITAGAIPTVGRNYVGRDNQLWARCLPDVDARMLSMIGADRDLQEYPRLVENLMNSMNIAGNPMTGQRRDSIQLAVAPIVRIREHAQQLQGMTCQEILRVRNPENELRSSVEKMGSLYSVTGPLFRTVLAGRGALSQQDCDNFKYSMSMYTKFFSNLQREVFGNENLTFRAIAQSFRRAVTTLRGDLVSVMDNPIRYRMDFSGISENIRAECTSLSQDINRLLCTDFTTVAVSQNEMHRSFVHFNVSRCNGPGRPSPSAPSLESAFGYDPSVYEDRKRLDDVNTAMCGGYNHWLHDADRCPGGDTPTSVRVECHQKYKVEDYCASLKAGGLRLDAVCKYYENFLPQRPLSVTYPTARDYEEATQRDEIIMIGKRRSAPLGSPANDPPEDLVKTVSNGLNSVIEEVASAAEINPVRPTALPPVAPLPVIGPSPAPAVVAAAPPVPEPSPAPPLRPEPRMAQSAPPSRLEKLREEIKRLEDQIAQEAAQSSPGPQRRVTQPSRPAVNPDSVAEEPVVDRRGGGAFRAPASQPAASSDSTTSVQAPASLPSVIVPNPAPAPAGMTPAGIDFAQVVSNKESLASQANGAASLARSAMLIARVAVGTNADNEPISLPEPGATVSSEEDFVSYIRESISTELLQHGPRIIQVGPGGSVWKVELRNGVVVVEPVLEKEISPVRQFYVSMLKEALRAVGQHPSRAIR